MLRQKKSTSRRSPGGRGQLTRHGFAPGKGNAVFGQKLVGGVERNVKPLGGVEGGRKSTNNYAGGGQRPLVVQRKKTGREKRAGVASRRDKHSTRRGS